MAWQQFGFFKKWINTPEQPVLKEEEVYLEDHTESETVIVDGVEVPVEEVVINHAKLFFDDNLDIPKYDQMQYFAWFAHLQATLKLETQEDLENHIWELGGKPEMDDEDDRKYAYVRTARLAVLYYLNEWREEIASRVVFECDNNKDWTVTVDGKPFAVKFGGLPNKHDVIPAPFYNFKNNKAIMHVLTVDGVVSILINRDYQIIKALGSDGNSIDKFTVDRSGNVLDLLMVNTTLSELVNGGKKDV